LRGFCSSPEIDSTQAWFNNEIGYKIGVHLI
jgi:hypothetical protein